MTDERDKTLALFDRASKRVSYSPTLASHYDTIFAEGWGDDEEHLRWVLSAPVREIAGWAETIEKSNE